MAEHRIGISVDARKAKTGADTAVKGLRDVKGAARDAAGQLVAMDRQLDRSAGAFAKFGAGLKNRFGGGGLGQYLAFGAVALAAKTAVADLAKLEKAQISIENVLGESSTQSSKRVADLLKVTQTLSLTTEATVDLAEALAQIGFRDDLARQTQIFGRELATTGLATKAGALALAQYSEAAGTGKEGIRQLNADLNTLGDEFAAQPEKVLSGANTLLFALKQYKVTSDAALALAAAVERVGGEAPMAAMGLSKLFAEADPKWIQQFKDGDEAVAALLERLRRETDAGTLGNFLESVGLDDPRSAKSLSALATSADLYAQALGRVKDKQGNLTSTIGEGKRVAESLSAELGNWRKTLDAVLYSQSGATEGLKGWSRAARSIVGDLTGVSAEVSGVTDKATTLKTALAAGGTQWLLFGASAKTSIATVGTAYAGLKIGEHLYEEFESIRNAADASIQFLIQGASLVELAWKNVSLSVGMAAIKGFGDNTVTGNLPDWVPGSSYLRGATMAANAIGKADDATGGIANQQSENIRKTLETLANQKAAYDKIAADAQKEFADPNRKGTSFADKLRDPETLARNLRSIVGDTTEATAALAGLDSVGQSSAETLKAIDTAARQTTEAVRLGADSYGAQAKAVESATEQLSAYEQMLRDTARATKLLTYGPLDRSARADADQIRQAASDQNPNLSAEDLEAIDKATVTTRQLYYEMERVRNASDAAGMAIANSFEDAVVMGGNLSDTLESLYQDLERIILRLTVTEPMGNMLGSLFNAGLGGLGGLMGGAGDYTQSWYARNLPGRASGGPVEANRDYLVGENGPEILRMGNSGGLVIPEVPPAFSVRSGGGGEASPVYNVTINLPAGSDVSERGMRLSVSQAMNDFRRSTRGRR